MEAKGPIAETQTRRAARWAKRDPLELANRATAAPRDRPLRYYFGPGFEQLREQLAWRYTRDRGLPVDLDWFRLTNGSSGGIDLLFAMSGGHGVVSVGTFSKILATGLRVGWIHARPEWIEFFGRMRFDMGQSVLIHRMLAEYIEGGRLDAHVERMRAVYADKAQLLSRSLEEFAGRYLDFTSPRGGFYLWVELLGRLTADALWRAGAEEGVWFPLGSSFFPDRIDPTGEHIRIAFPWTSTEELREGARRIGTACERLARGGS
jgi:DNA-binding transcriptional MocR family regulator